MMQTWQKCKNSISPHLSLSCLSAMPLAAVRFATIASSINLMCLGSSNIAVGLLFLALLCIFLFRYVRQIDEDLARLDRANAELRHLADLRVEQLATDFVHARFFDVETECKFFSGTMILKCAVNPTSKTCVGCRHFEPKQ